MNNKRYFLPVLAAVIATLVACSGARPDYQIALDKLNCPMCDLRYENFSKRKLDNLSVPGAFLFGANLSWASLRNADLESAVLSEASLEWSDFDNAILTKSTLQDATLFRSSFRNANLKMIKGDRASFTDSVIDGADFSTASLIKTDFGGSDAKGVNMSNADLKGASFDKADVRNASFKGSKLSGASLSGIRSLNADFSGSVMSGADLSYTHLQKVNFRDADLSGANLSNSILDGVNFNNSSLKGANLLNASLNNVVFRDADLCDAILPDGSLGSCSEGQATYMEMSRFSSPGSNSRAVANKNQLVVALPGNMYADLHRGKPRGAMVEALHEVLSGLGITPKYIVMSFSDSKTAMEAGTVDIVVSRLILDFQHDELVYTDPMIREYLVLLAVAGQDQELASINDLSGYQLGGREGYTYPTLDNKPDIEIQRYPKDGDIIRSLLVGDLDFALISGVSDINLFRGESILHEFDTHDKALGYVDLGIAFAPKAMSKQQIATVKQAVNELMKTAKWQAILQRNGISDLVEPWDVLE